MGSSGEKSAKKAKKEKKDTPKSSKKRDRDGLPVPSSASKGGEGDDDEKQNPVCAIASPLADGKLTKKLLKVVKKGKQMNKSGVVISEEGEERHPCRHVSLVLLLLRILFSLFGSGILFVVEFSLLELSLLLSLSITTTYTLLSLLIKLLLF